MEGISDGTGYDTEEDRSYWDVASDYGRAAAQGLTFGFADEVEAYVKSSLEEGVEYKDVVAEVRQKINRFREENPAAAWGVEIAASVLPIIAAQFIPGAGQVAGGARVAQLAGGAGRILASPTGRAAVTSGGQGALYGAGVAEGGIGERAEAAAISGPISAVAGGALHKIAPRITTEAKELIRRGIPVTAGQAVRGSGYLGKVMGRIEEQVADTVPFIGDAIRGAFDRSRTAFNRASVNEALDPLDLQAPRGYEGRRLIDWGQKQINRAYNAALKDMKISDQMPLYNGIFRVVDNAHKDIRDDVLDRVEGIIFKQFDKGNGTLSGAALKEAQSRLRRDRDRLRTAGYNDEKQARLADALEDVLSIFSNELSKQNPKLAPRLISVDKAYGNFEIVRNASLRRTAEESFTPAALLAATARGDPTRRRSQFSGGQARLQPFAQDAQDVLGSTVSDSGTAGRLMAAKLVTGGGLGAGVMSDPTVAVPIIGGLTGAYSRMGVPIARTAVDIAGRGMRGAAPVLSAQVPQQQDLPDNLRRMLSRALVAANR